MTTARAGIVMPALMCSRQKGTLNWLEWGLFWAGD
jgi:hypothetical protein